MTEDFRKAVDRAKEYEPRAWRDPNWSHQAHRAFIFRAVADQSYPNGPDLVYARWTEKFRGKMRWREAWTDPVWEKAYRRITREAEWAAKREAKSAKKV